MLSFCPTSAICPFGLSLGLWLLTHSHLYLTFFFPPFDFLAFDSGQDIAVPASTTVHHSQCNASMVEAFCLASQWKAWCLDLWSDWKTLPSGLFFGFQLNSSDAGKSLPLIQLGHIFVSNYNHGVWFCLRH